MKIAYLVNQYPGISHSFIRREILALERAGIAVARFAVRRPRHEVVGEADKAEQKRTSYIVGAPALSLIKAAATTVVANPFGVVAAAWETLRLGWRSESGLARHIFYFVEALALATWLRQSEASHLHAHFGTNSATVALLAALMAHITFSITVHGPEEFDKPGLIGLKRKIEKAAFIAAVSSYGRSQLRRLVTPKHWNKLKIIHCGVEAAFFEGEASRPPAMKRFVCVGRLCEQKGQITLVEAAAMLKRKGLPFEIALVGDGEMRGEIEQALRDQDVADRIVLLGWKSPEDVRTEIEASRAFVLPSYAEGLPVSIMEAFLLTRPVISTYVAGIPELVAPGENGWLVPASDAEALSAALEDAMNASDDKILAMGRAGKQKTISRHNIEMEAAKLAQCFAETGASQP